MMMNPDNKEYTNSAPMDAYDVSCCRSVIERREKGIDCDSFYPIVFFLVGVCEGEVCLGSATVSPTTHTYTHSRGVHPYNDSLTKGESGMTWRCATYWRMQQECLIWLQYCIIHRNERLSKWKNNNYPQQEPNKRNWLRNTKKSKCVGYCMSSFCYPSRRSNWLT